MRRFPHYFPLVLAACLVVSLFLPSRPSQADDRDLLRFGSAEPYLMIVLDTSASMNLKLDGTPTRYGGDDPESRIYMAKEAIYTVVNSSEETGVRFGLATTNQDELRVQGKHYLYFGQALPTGWPIAEWPHVDAAGIGIAHRDNSGDGAAEVIHDVTLEDGIPSVDVWSFGRLIPSDPYPGSTGVLGSCALPMNPDDALERYLLNTFPKLGRDGTESTVLWVAGQDDTTYRITFEGNASPFAPGTVYGVVGFSAAVSVDSTTDCSAFTAADGSPFTFQMVRDPDLDEYLINDQATPAGVDEPSASDQGHWNYADSVTGYSCTEAQPFSGFGIDGNYDSLTSAEAPDDISASVTDVDKFCFTTTGEAEPHQVCIELKPAGVAMPVAAPTRMQTEFEPTLGRALDRGDFLPFDWREDRSHRAQLLRRLAPNHPSPNPDFGLSGYYDDSWMERNNSEEAFHDLKNPLAVPTVAQGETPLARIFTDIRCWYMGTAKGKGGSPEECTNSAFNTESGAWRNIACDEDSDYGCRKPFMVIITDAKDDSGKVQDEGHSGCQLANPVATLSDMKSFASFETFGIYVGEGDGCKGTILHRVEQATGGDCITVRNKNELVDKLRQIVGDIRQEATTFASAAVPTVQASVQQSIYVSDFTPVESAYRWDGHMNAFLKPLPLTDTGAVTGKPDKSVVCQDLTDTGCFLWDAGDVIDTAQYPSTLNSPPDGSEFLNTSFNPSSELRHVFYSRESAEGAWPVNREFFTTTAGDGSGGTTAKEIDFWEGLGLTGTDDDNRDLANDIVRDLLTVKTVTIPEDTENPNRRMLMGDIFHSNPVVVGTPVNTRFFAQNEGGAIPPGTCREDGTGDKGYRCFFQRMKNRRKTLLVGTNEGALHAFNAGIYRPVDERFDNGTGHEMFGFIPREILPVIKETFSEKSHHFTVDGSPIVSDVFIDPLAQSGSTFPTEADREWRTVAVTGLRRGGKSYFALDITQPDPVTLDATTGEFEPNSTGAVTMPATYYPPTCLEPGVSGCGPIPYASQLWEFRDTTADSTFTTPSLEPATPVLMDEDGNAKADLAQTWSTPNIGRIQVCKKAGSTCNAAAVPNDLVEKYVAVFGGGLNPQDKTGEGNFIYMVDIETGHVLYKRAVEGAIPGGTAAVDTNQDGFLDRIYAGTTLGLLYRVDLTPIDNSGTLPAIVDEEVTDNASPAVTHTVERIDRGTVADPIWEPYVLMDTRDQSQVNPAPRPIYHRPSVFFVAKLGIYGIAVGTGDREDLWSAGGEPGRFFVFVDDSEDASPPFTEANFLEIAPDLDAAINDDLFVLRGTGQKGWYFTLGEKERLITEPATLFGVVFFASYTPETAITTEEGCDPLDPNQDCEELELTCGEGTKWDTVSGFCSKTGFSNIFVVAATNGDPLLPPTDGTTTRNRSRTITQFVTRPFTEPGQSKNVDSDDDDDDDPRGPTADDLTANDIEIMNLLKSMYPSECRFANYWIDVKTIASNTKVERIAPVPICFIEKNWKEF